MDPLLAGRLDSESPAYDSELFSKLTKVASEYVQAGAATLNYFVCDLDAANDIVEMYAPVTKEDFEKKDRNAPKNFIHPMTTTEIWTLSTFVSQILFGAESNRTVEPRTDADEAGADAINQLLAWNDAQQDSYKLGFLWIKDACTFNRGIMYDQWLPMVKVTVEQVEEDDTSAEMVPVMRKDGTGPRYRNGETMMEYPKRTRWRKKREQIGGYNHIDLVSPYDFICDPEMPNLRFQEGRFAGHRVMIPWLELKRRSELDPSDSQYVLPSTVKKLKNKKQGSGPATAVNAGGPIAKSASRSYYERQRRGAALGGVAMGQVQSINKEDGGVVECWAITIKMVPKTYGIYDDTESELVEILFSGQNDLLSVNILSNVHDEYPYSVGEARPHAHYQFSPGWALVAKPIQDYVDYLKRRHAINVAQNGNIFIGDPTMFDMEAFLDPDKDGLLIPTTAEAQGKPLDQIIKQLATTDTTARFHEEMLMWIGQSENALGTHPNIQGQTEDEGQTATQFVGVQQMGTGRLSTIARLLSPGICQQTRRFVSNFQQFSPDEQVIRITGEDENYDPDVPPKKYVTIRRDDIQGEYDVTPHDGAMPGTDARKVAALTRMMEASANPAFAQFFDNTIPGNMDGKAILFEVAKSGGMPVNNFIVTRKQAQDNLREKQMAAGIGVQPPPRPPSESMNYKDLSPEDQAAMLQQANLPVPNEQLPDGQTIPSASQLPPTPSAAPPQPNPAQV